MGNTIGAYDVAAVSVGVSAVEPLRAVLSNVELALTGAGTDGVVRHVAWGSLPAYIQGGYQAR